LQFIQISLCSWHWRLFLMQVSSFKVQYAFVGVMMKMYERLLRVHEEFEFILAHETTHYFISIIVFWCCLYFKWKTLPNASFWALLLNIFVDLDSNKLKQAITSQRNSNIIILIILLFVSHFYHCLCLRIFCKRIYFPLLMTF
jgi:hypothetical protein